MARPFTEIQFRSSVRYAEPRVYRPRRYSFVVAAVVAVAVVAAAVLWTLSHC